MQVILLSDSLTQINIVAFGIKVFFSLKKYEQIWKVFIHFSSLRAVFLHLLLWLNLRMMKCTTLEIKL